MGNVVWLFSYGSNDSDQLSDRIERHDFETKPAVAPDVERVFRGFSQRWRGGTASLEPRRDGRVFGYVSRLREGDLKKLDRFEGVGLGIYQRWPLEVILENGRRLGAEAYVHASTEFNPPSAEYLSAVARTIGRFWRGARGPVTPSDIPIC